MIHLASSAFVILEYTFGTEDIEVNKIRIVLLLHIYNTFELYVIRDQRWHLSQGESI